MRRVVVAGAALSLTGRFAVQGEQAQRGLLLWAEHVNEAGGLAVPHGAAPRPVRLRVYDDCSTIAGAAAATERLIVQDQADLLFSPYGSVLALAAAEVTERHGRILWNHGGSSDALEQRGFQRVVTLLSSASRYFVPILDLAMHHATVRRPVRTVALLHGARGTFPQAVIGGARARAEQLGLQIVLDETYPSTPALPATQGDPLVARLARLQPDVILGVGTTEADLAFAQALRGQRVTTGLIALVAAPIERFQEVLGAAADGFCGPSQWEPGLTGQPDLGPSSDEFSSAFRGRFGLEPDYPAAQAYAAGLIAARCAQGTGSFDDNALRAVAGCLDRTTFYGRFRLDPATGQQVGHTIVVVQWQAGRKQLVWPAGVSTASLQLLDSTALRGGLADEAPSS